MQTGARVGAPWMNDWVVSTAYCSTDAQWSGDSAEDALFEDKGSRWTTQRQGTLLRKFNGVAVRICPLYPDLLELAARSIDS